MTANRVPTLAVASAFTFLFACESGGVGDPCVPEHEYSAHFSGFSVDEVDVESRSMQCETRLCLVNHFQGRVTCPYGQTDERARNDPRCFVPGGKEPVTVAVAPQLRERRPVDSVYCSCRCNGPDANARYCDCPTGFACRALIPKFGLGNQELAGSYCIREGTGYAPETMNVAVCDPAQSNCSD
jgi:hypothetical protein